MAATTSDLILFQNFHYLTVPWEKMSLMSFLDSKAKTRGIALKYFGGSLRTLTLLIHTRKSKQKKAVTLRKKFKLVKAV